MLSKFRTNILFLTLAILSSFPLIYSAAISTFTYYIDIHRSGIERGSVPIFSGSPNQYAYATLHAPCNFRCGPTSSSARSILRIHRKLYFERDACRDEKKLAGEAQERREKTRKGRGEEMRGEESRDAHGDQRYIAPACNASYGSRKYELAYARLR